ncbi:MAG: SIS domain-containing protein [Acidobacteriota bacterium]
MEYNADSVREKINDSIGLKKKLLEDFSFSEAVLKAADTLIRVLRRGGRVLFCGNGGSAADAQHFAAELSGKFLVEREPLDAEALHVNTSFITAVANDYGFTEAYARLVRAKGRQGDVVVGISTSGNSPNMVRAFEAARESGIATIGLTGEKGGAMASLSDVLIAVPSRSTPRIQEAHQLIGHILCEIVETACCESGSEK